jgi:ribosomal protein S17
MGEEKAHFAINLFQDGDKLSLDDCRKRVRDIAADIEQRFGVKMDGALGDMRDEVALKLGDDDKRTIFSQFMFRETKMNNGRKNVKYRVNGMIGMMRTKPKQPSIEFEIVEESER